MRHKRVTIEDVARAAGVSITTVSRFLNHQFGAMSVSTKERIERTIKELNYQPNALAQGLKGNKTRTIAIAVVNIGYPFCSSIIRSLSEVLAQAGYRLTVCDTNGDANRERALIESLMAQRVEGIVIQTNGDNNQLLAEAAKQIPVVLVDRQFDIPHTINVITNNEDASLQLTRSLFQAGYKDVVYLTEPVEQISTRQGRLLGYQRACLEAGRPSYIVWVNKDEPNTFEEAVRQINRLDLTKPAAIYTANGLIMLSFYPLIRTQSWSVPGEFGLATFDEPDWVRLTEPPLTCVRQPTTEMGQFCGQAILKALRGRKVHSHQTVKVFPSQIILSESTTLKPPNA